ncbi:MAG TPA: hypothetical protein VII32_14695, partial [Thermoanaerobaculia bacterium]
GAIAAIKDPKFPTIGAEGWYLDEMRTMEACLVAVVFGAAFSARRVAQVSIVLLLIANVAGTLLLLLPHWAGYSGHEIGFDVYRGAIEAAPIHRFTALPLAIAIGWLLALLGAVKFADEPRPIRVG